MILRTFLAAFLLTLAGALVVAHPETQLSETPKAATSDSPIRFAYQAVDFKLDSNESPEHHAPETMAGGVAVFDYNNDGKLDIFFTNGADLKTLKKDSAKYYNRLFETTAKDTLPTSRKRPASLGQAMTPASRSATTTTMATKTSS